MEKRCPLASHKLDSSKGANRNEHNFPSTVYGQSEGVALFIYNGMLHLANGFKAEKELRSRRYRHSYPESRTSVLK